MLSKGVNFHGLNSIRIPLCLAASRPAPRCLTSSTQLNCGSDTASAHNPFPSSF